MNKLDKDHDKLVTKEEFNTYLTEHSDIKSMKDSRRIIELITQAVDRDGDGIIRQNDIDRTGEDRMGVNVSGNIWFFVKSFVLPITSVLSYFIFT